MHPAFIAGRGGVRQQLFQLFSDLPEVRLVAGYMSDEEYRENLRSSKFCLCPRGNEVTVRSPHWGLVYQMVCTSCFVCACAHPFPPPSPLFCPLPSSRCGAQDCWSRYGLGVSLSLLLTTMFFHWIPSLTGRKQLCLFLKETPSSY